MSPIVFNKPYFSGKEQEYVAKSIATKHLSGDGPYTKGATKLLESALRSRVLLTTSCTDALEMISLLLNIGPGDEVIVPSYTFTSTALAFVMRGATIKFADSEPGRPHLSIESVESLITSKTKAIVPVHYGGEAVDMGALTYCVSGTKIAIVEDAAQAFGSYYQGLPLGAIGDLGAISFHESKNITCGEGGALIVENEELYKRAQIIREKGTDRTAFFNGEVKKYGWKDLGSSYLPSDILSAYLCGQLEGFDFAQKLRMTVYRRYFNELAELNEKGILLPKLSPLNVGNGHIFYIVCRSNEEREEFSHYMKSEGIACLRHYESLHKSDYFANQYTGPQLKNSDKFSDCLIRFPIYADLLVSEQDKIVDRTLKFFKER